MPLEIYFGDVSDCHRPLIDGEDGVGDDAFSASSTAQDGSQTHSPARARFSTEVEVSEAGIMAGAWVPQVSDKNQWLQVCRGETCELKQTVCV